MKQQKLNSIRLSVRAKLWLIMIWLPLFFMEETCVANVSMFLKSGFFILLLESKQASTKKSIWVNK